MGRWDVPASVRGHEFYFFKYPTFYLYKKKMMRGEYESGRQVPPFLIGAYGQKIRLQIYLDGYFGDLEKIQKITS